MIHAVMQSINSALVVAAFIATLVACGLIASWIIQHFDDWRHRK